MSDTHKHYDPSKDRVVIDETFTQKPAVPADYAAQYNPLFTYSGYSGHTGQVTHTADGLKIQPSGFSSSFGCVQPYSGGALALSGYLAAGKQPSYYIKYKTGSSVASHIIHAGLKVTQTDVVATDDDQVFFRFADGFNDNKVVLHISNAGTDYAYLTDTVLVADTVYEFEIDIDENGKVRAYINGNSVKSYPLTGPATNAALYPYQGVKSTSTSAPSWIIKRLIVGKNED